MQTQEPFYKFNQSLPDFKRANITKPEKLITAELAGQILHPDNL